MTHGRSHGNDPASAGERHRPDPRRRTPARTARRHRVNRPGRGNGTVPARGFRVRRVGNGGYGAEPMRLTITRPDDWHLHLRDGAALAAVLPDTAHRFARAIVMPNLKPPVTTVAQANEYRQRILAALPRGRRSSR